MLVETANRLSAHGKLLTTQCQVTEIAGPNATFKAPNLGYLNRKTMKWWGYGTPVARFPGSPLNLLGHAVYGNPSRRLNTTKNVVVS